jgi:hypothetical protein
MKTEDILLVELLSGLHLALIATLLLLDFPMSNCWSKSNYGRMQPPYLHSRHWLTFAEISHESSSYHVICKLRLLVTAYLHALHKA